MSARMVLLFLRFGLVVTLAAALAHPDRHAAAQEGGADVGTIRGSIVDKASGTPVVDAVVELVGTALRTRTDLDGRYLLRAAPGTYELRVIAPLYRSMRIRDLLVRPNQVSTADAALESAGQAGIDTVEVIATAQRATEAAQLARRKAEAVVSETISREAMKRTVGSGASDIVKRLPGLVVRDDRYLVIRGLGDRYVGALLNDNRLPSPDPFRRAVPLDLFPVDFLDDLAVYKTYAPNLPGDFVAGLVALGLRDFPDKLEYSLGVRGGVNIPQTTGQDFLTYRGSPLDNLTLGTRFREPPATTPPFSVAEVPETRRYRIARGFRNIWSFEKDDAPPNYGGNFSIGNRWGPVGVQLGGIYSNEFRQANDGLRRSYRNPAGLDAGKSASIEVIDEFFDVDQGRQTVKLGGVLTTGWQISDQHRLTFRGLVNRFGVDTVQREFGIVENQRATDPQEFTRQWYLSYIVEQLAMGQMAGAHDLGFARLDWRSALSQTTRSEPDTRYVTYQGTRDRLRFSADLPLSGNRINNITREKLTDSMVDVTVPFPTRLPFTDVWRGLPAQFKFGPAYSYRQRSFDQRRFVFQANDATQDVLRRPEDLFAPSQLRPGLADFTEETRVSDSFEATQEIIGGYGLLDLPIVRNRLRVQGGARVEYSLIRLDTGVRNTYTGGPGTPLVCPDDPIGVDCFARFTIKTIDPLPAVNLVYSPLDDMNVRLSWSESVSRPEFRELAPAEFPTQRGERSSFGNPLLQPAAIRNWDVRWEWFFSPLELVSLSFFRKSIDQPIEKVSILAGPEIAETWLNAGAATVTGFEFEGRKNLGFVHRWLDPINLEVNAAYIDSTVTVPKTKVFGLETQQTSGERRMLDAAPFIVNASVEYSRPDLFTARLLYLTVGPTISSGGSVGVPDTIFERRNQLDAVLSVPLKRWTGNPLSLRVTAENLLNEPFVFTVGGEPLRRAVSGVKISFGISYSN